MAKISEIEIPKLLFDEGAAPSTPASTNVALYAKADGLLYSKDDAGTESPVSGAGALGAWTTFTPTITAAGGGFALGNGTLQGWYKLLDAATCHIKIFYQRGSTTTNGTGVYSFALPVTARATSPQVQVLSGIVLDAGTAYFVAAGYVVQGSTSVSNVAVADATGTRQLTHAVPFTFATGDEVILSGVIQV